MSIVDKEESLSSSASVTYVLSLKCHLCPDRTINYLEHLRSQISVPFVPERNSLYPIQAKIEGG